jgi:hypothetical protein
LNAGEEGSTPAAGLNVKPPLALGSGKLGTPLARMQRAYFSESCCCVWLDAVPEPAAPPAAFVLGAALADVVVVTLATDGARELPQPASTTTAAAAPASASPADRSRFLARSCRPGWFVGSALSLICSMQRAA